MPLPFLGNKFSPKKGPPRKSASLSNLSYDAEKRVAEFGMEVGPIKARLGEYVLELGEDGDWFLESGAGGSGSNYHEFHKLKKQCGQMTEENNLLKIKVELLLDMLSERSAEVHLLQNENEQLKKLSNRKR